MQQLHSMLTAAGIPYRIVGGMAVFIHVCERDPLRARLTADVDAAIDRPQLDSVADAARKAGWIFRHAAGVDMLTDEAQPRTKSAVHLLFLNEKVRPDYLEPVPASPPHKTREGISVASVADLVRMKLTSFRLKDRVHIPGSRQRRLDYSRDRKPVAETVLGAISRSSEKRVKD